MAESPDPVVCAAGVPSARRLGSRKRDDENDAGHREPPVRPTPPDETCDLAREHEADPGADEFAEQQAAENAPPLFRRK